MQTETNQPGEPRGAKRGVAMVAAIAVGLPLLYVLSIGPADLVMRKTHYFGGTVSTDSVDRFYYPVVWLHDHTFLERPIEIYVRLWHPPVYWD